MACPMSAALCTILSLLPYNFEYQTPADLASPKQLHDGDVYDFIIVGAGPAGSVLANRLSEIPSWKVLLLESGGEESKLGEIPAFQPFLSQTRFTWNYTTVPDDRICAGAPCLWVTGRGLGGGSLHNNMIYNRGNSHTFDEWEQMGNAGWGYEEMLYYFKKSENNQDPLIARNKIYHSTKGPQTVSQFPYVDKNVKKIIETFHQLGYPDADINGVNQTGVCLMQHLQKDGGRQSSAKSFLYPIREKRNNLKIVTNVRVTKVIINPQTKEAEGVEYTWENKRHVKGKVYARKEVIISTGPMATPQLLMLSGVGPNKTLVPLGIDVIQNLPVGQNYQNHIQSGSLNFTLNDTNIMMPNDEETLRDFLDYFTKRRGPLASEGFFDVSAFISSRYTDSSYPDVQIICSKISTLE
ncbi:hypothetical protein L9F63_017717 [Diploptera punctata]|uniref:Glucose-methanol-choline oxidoreductase N-terminal domain-containing protein n=1 Tax=Diploptera punctata TaxID=6984 RepID=A0AAD7ZYC4_DIPPU|nr:hypothetical protein L9F63_017717 [Diploptera punctata]